jgi:trk system potassium uptake protein TrkA
MKIVISGGEGVGYLFAKELFAQHEVFVIEQDAEEAKIFDEFDVKTIVGSPTDIEILKAARVDAADYFIACNNSDEVNIISSLAAKNLGNAYTFCFVNEDHYFETFRGSLGKSLEIDELIWAEKVIAENIARIINVSGAVSVEIIDENVLTLLEFPIKDGCSFLGKSLKEMKLPKGVLAVAFIRGEEILIPDGDTIPEENDKILFLGFQKSMNQIESRFAPPSTRSPQVTIVGGGIVGGTLAKKLDEIGKHEIRIIEPSLERCQSLAKEFGPKTIVFAADGTDPEVLREQLVPDSHCLVAVTGNDERNLFISLMAKEMNVKKIIARVKNPEYVEFFKRHGVDVALSPRSIAFQKVIGGINDADGDIVSVLAGGRAQIISVQVASDFTEIQVRELDLPKGILVSAIRRKAHTIVPHGEDLIKPHDRLRVFCMNGQEDIVKKYFGHISEQSGSK